MAFNRFMAWCKLDIYIMGITFCSIINNRKVFLIETIRKNTKDIKSYICVIYCNDKLYNIQ